jgi:hypothetical protein
MVTGSTLREVSASVIFAENAQNAALSALFWWLIPITALFGAIIYVIWVTRFKSKYENRIDRSVDRFRKFQDSFNQDPAVRSRGDESTSVGTQIGNDLMDDNRS